MLSIGIKYQNCTLHTNKKLLITVSIRKIPSLNFQRRDFFRFELKIEKGGEVSTLFVPNLTINLTYLCYGSTKLLVLR